MINYIKRFWQRQMAEAYNYLPLCICNLITKILIITIPLTILLVCCSCGSTKMVTETIPVETIRETLRVDTIYLNHMQYDSIYVSTDKSQEYHLNPLNRLNDFTPDTIVITQHDVEYRYRLLHDTIYKTDVITQRDSIPYEVTVTQYRNVPYIPWYAKTLIWIGAISIFAFIIFLIIKLS